MQTLLNELPRFVYGTTRLGDEGLPFQERVNIAKEALRKADWFHTSHTYGDALQVIARAAKELGKRPKTIGKIGWDSADQVREVLHQNSECLETKTVEIGQLCMAESLSEQFRNGKGNDALNQLKKENLVGSFVLETWPWTSSVPLDAIASGHAFELIEGLIFYFNPLQRFVTNPLWDLIQKEEIPFVAMRTTCGGSLERLLTDDKAPAYLKTRARELEPIYRNSGCESWTEFCTRFALGDKGVVATVGATSNLSNLDLLVNSVKNFSPLAEDLQEQIYSLHRKWSDEHDCLAEPWSM